MKRKAASTVDPLDLAMSSSRNDRLSDQLIAHHIDLAAAQLTEIRLKRILWGGLVLVMLLLLLLLAVAMFRASRSHALIVEPFHVPASLEARGIDGSFVASRMIDQLAVLRDKSDSARAEDSYANSGDSDIKIAIPDIGVSIGEMWNYLRDWLGHDRKIGGDVTIDGDQAAVTARITGGNGETFTAPLADPTPAIDAAALAIFKQTQPYRYALYIGQTQGPAAAIPLFRDLAEQSEDVRERQWGYIGWESELAQLGRNDEAELRGRQGIALDPAFGKIYTNLGNALANQGRTEAALAAYRKALELLKTPVQSQLSPAGFSHTRDETQSSIDGALRDDQSHLAALQHEGTLPEYWGSSRNARIATLIELSRLGEFRRVADSLSLLPLADPAFAANSLATIGEFAMEVGRPAKAAAFWEQAIARVKLPAGATFAQFDPADTARYAEILVAAGRAGEAANMIAPTRGDCYPCLVARGEIAAAQGDPAAATRWFAEAARQGPSLPQADYQWGVMLAARGDRAGALAHFAVAAERAPHWYQPPLAAGSALIALHRFAEARSQLERAHDAAPKRADVLIALGRAKWLAGDHQAALASWRQARGLDLLDPDVAWLKRIDSIAALRS